MCRPEEQAQRRSVRGAHRTHVVAARIAGYWIELPTQSDLSGRVCHGTGAAGKRDQRSKPSVSGRQIDRPGVSPKDFIAALQSDDAVPGEKEIVGTSGSPFGMILSMVKR